MPSNRTYTLIINGQAFEASKAPVSWEFARLGWGLFETLRAHKTHIEFIQDHYERLQRSCGSLGFTTPSFHTFKEQLYRALVDNDLTHSVARLRYSIISPSPGSKEVTQIAEATEFQTYPDNAVVKLLRGALSSQAPLAPHKTLSYGTHAYGLAQAKQAGADEGLWLNELGHLCEGCTSNLFFIKNGVLHTPSLDCGILPGVIRKLVLEIAQKNHLPVLEGHYTLQDLEESDAAFLTSSLRGIQTIKMFVEFHNKCEWNTHPVVSNLKNLLSELLESEKSTKSLSLPSAPHSPLKIV